ncbi:MAG: hypothetical protein J1F32_04955 [Erysipelotrichales bacterium]|nr:hypothetical protein [Erysipelotrichales bacterium]
MKRRNFLLGLAMVGTVFGLTGCGDETSTSESVNQPSVPSSVSTPTSNSQSNSTGSDAPLHSYIVVRVSEKQSFETFKTNRQEKTNKQTEFYDRTREYTVGDDNKFNVKPRVDFLDENLMPAIPSEWSYEIEILKKNDSDAFVALGENDLARYVESIDNKNCDIDFKEEAVGETFKIVVAPEGLSNSQKGDEDYYADIVVKVVDGFNAYAPKELGYYDNRTNDQGKAWKAFKEENGLDPDYKPNSIVLHNDIKVTENDVPSVFFYNEGDEDLPKGEGVVGSLRDYAELYLRQFDTSDEDFALYGNYFTLNFTGFPLVKRERDHEEDETRLVISHAVAFRAEPKNGAYDKQFTYRDINIFGNAQRKEDTDLGGGLIFNKTHDMKALAENVITRAWFITYFTQNAHSDYVVNYCKSYDNYNSFIYSWGGNLVGKNSEMIGAGGPVVLQDHTNIGKSSESVPSTKFENCKLESLVAGTEGWFSSFGAVAAAQQIKQLDTIFRDPNLAALGQMYGVNTNRTILQTDPTIVDDAGEPIKLINLICVNKDGSMDAMPEGVLNIKGSIQFDNNPAFDFGETDAEFRGFMDRVSANSAANVILQGCGTKGYAFTDHKGLYTDVSNGEKIPFYPPNVNMGLFEGDYLQVYFFGMGITLGYY